MTFRCECDTPERAAFTVTDHTGNTSNALYCDGCADLARMDANGETRSISPEPWCPGDKLGGTCPGLLPEGKPSDCPRWTVPSP